MILETKNLGIAFGGLKALEGVDLKVKEKEIVGLIGPNGAGKTTFFNLLTAVYPPTSGEIFFEGKPLRLKKTFQINKVGIARTFQNIRLFKEMSVIDNIKLALHNRFDYSISSALFRLSPCLKQEKEMDKKALSLLDVFEMAGLADHLAGNLPYGQQRKLEILRALASSPKLLLLDEPAAGMNPTETADLMQSIKKIRDEFGVAILLIEHDMHLVMNLCENLFVLDYGMLIASGTSEEIQRNERVISAYLGS